MTAPAEYTCSICKTVFVVPSMARHCEQKHANG